MIISEHGYFLVPENEGNNCPSKGAYCQRCAYTVCCRKEHPITECLLCKNEACPHAVNKPTHLD